MDEFDIRPVDSSQLSKRIRVALLEWIQTNSTDGDKPFRLPNEDELARRLGVSRTGLRDALTVMEGEGYITRRRGIGTLVNPKVAQCRTRLDLQTELSAMIAAQGYKATFKLIDLQFVNELLPSFPSEETEYLKIEKVFYADGIPAAYCDERIAGSLAEKVRPYLSEFATNNSYDFLKKHIGVLNAYLFSGVKAALPTAHVAELMHIPPSMPVLTLSNVTYDYDHRPYLDSNVVLRTDILELTLLRKPI